MNLCQYIHQIHVTDELMNLCQYVHQIRVTDEHMRQLAPPHAVATCLIQIQFISNIHIKFSLIF
jgi:hypothetical protein